MSRRRKEKSGRHSTDEPERSACEPSRRGSERFDDQDRSESRDDIEVVVRSSHIDFVEWT